MSEINQEGSNYFIKRLFHALKEPQIQNFVLYFSEYDFQSFTFIQNEIEIILDLPEYQQNSLKIILVVHKKIRYQRFDADVPYSVFNNWNYVVLENLGSPNAQKDPKIQRRQKVNNVDFLGKSKEEIFKEMTAKGDLAFFMKIVEKSLEKLACSRVEFERLREIVFDMEQRQGGQRDVICLALLRIGCVIFVCKE